MTAAARKLWVVAAAELSPARGPIAQLGYLLLFLHVHVLAVVGCWRSRSDWRVHSVVWLVIASFAATTAIFWAHTSHKSYLDPVLFVYAAAGTLMLFPVRLTKGAMP